MSRRNLVILIIATVVIVLSLVVITGRSGEKGVSSKPTVAPVHPEFDTETIKRLEAFFPVQFDLSNLGRPDPFAGI